MADFGTSLRLRPARSDDADALAVLIYKFHEKVKPPYSYASTLASIKPGDILWVAERDGVLVGYVWFTVKGPREVFLEQIYADEEITDGLEAILIPMLRDAGFSIITAVALREGWKKMFTRWGFRPVGVLLERVLETREMQRLPDLGDG